MPGQDSDSFCTSRNNNIQNLLLGLASKPETQVEYSRACEWYSRRNLCEWKEEMTAKILSKILFWLKERKVDKSSCAGLRFSRINLWTITWGSPEKFGVERFKLAIGKVSGIKIVGTQARYFFLEAAREISEKWNFFVKRSIPKNFGRENFSGQVPTESLRTQDSENVYERWVQQIFDPVSVGRSWVSATKRGPLAKLWAVKKNKHGHNFQNIGSNWISMGS